jgi:hypothetical protein
MRSETVRCPCVASFGGVLMEAGGRQLVQYLPRHPIWTFYDDWQLRRQWKSWQSRPGRNHTARQPSVVLCPLTHGIWLYLLSTAYLHSGLHLGPVLNPCPSCRCPQIPILGYRTRTKRPRARSRLTTCPPFYTSRGEIYARRTRVNRVAERSPSPGMQILSTRFSAFVCQLCTCAIRSQMFIVLS